MTLEVGRSSLGSVTPVQVAGSLTPLQPDQWDPHGALQPLEKAGRLARAKVAVLPLLMHWGSSRWVPGKAELPLKALAFLGAHLGLVGKLWRRRDLDLIIVREFLTAFLIVVWPLIWPLRQRVFFLVNHNLQEAHRRSLERALLRVLYLTGIRIACLETPAGFAELGIAPAGDRFLILPHPVASVAPRQRPAVSKPPVIGVIGSVRAEKGVEEILERLLELRAQSRLSARLVLGSAQAEVRAIWRHRGFEVIDTSEQQGYLAALELCDVVVLNYRRDRYYYRSSGVAADAIARRAAVVAPDFPLIRHQLTEPASVGCLFRDLQDLERITMDALQLRTADADPWVAHEAARSPIALARLIDAFVERAAGST